MDVKRLWTPPAIPLMNNLASWKAINLDIHNNLVASGFLQTSDTGQLNFDDVTAVQNNGTFVGYRVYRLEDAFVDTLPIIIKIEFGWGSEGGVNYNSYLKTKTPYFKVTVGVATNGSGVFIGNKDTFLLPFMYNYTANGTYSTQNNNAGVSILCRNDTYGCYSFFYGINSRNTPTDNLYTPSASLSFCIQRSFDENGNITKDWFSIIRPTFTVDMSYQFPYYNSVFASGDIMAIQKTFTPLGLLSTSYHSTRVGNSNISQAVGGEVLFQPVYCYTPMLRRSYVGVTYYRTDLDPYTIVNLPVSATTKKNYITIGPYAGMIMEPTNANFSCLAVLYEGTDLVV